VTAPRGKIEASLAERGRPAMWANEQEAAVLSGYSPERFRAALTELEKAGFPQVNTWNSLRFIPAIEDFWRRQLDAIVPPVPLSEADERNLEDFTHGQPQSQRIAS
jgi:hypothetical protein